ncbi:MAG: multifunctional oxoglutarate decarboxylase/oxoglutarate dehydrogenase thiamine pyrophosphate-binding subunit/dihydrolipoyllysine-residue succinyltransferase subunit [Acidobacteriota bacterium]
MTTGIKPFQIDQLIADEFGVNADYVLQLLYHYQQNPASVGEEWREYFLDVLGESPAQLQPQQPAARVEQKVEPQATQPLIEGESVPLRGAALKIAENMEASLAVPTATSQRVIPIKLLDENRRVINDHLKASGRKASFTHIIAFAVLKALERFPALNDSFEIIDGAPARVHPSNVNLGIAVDVTRKDGTRSLLVPNIRAANKLDFSQLLLAYDDIIRRAREGRLQVADFQSTTISITNPGTIGTTASNPRLMAGQGAIIATGAIETPAEYRAMSPEALSRLGISKVMTVTSTYDHRVIQGAESGAFLACVEELLGGGYNFYDEIFAALAISFRPYVWAMDVNPALLGEAYHRDEIRKQSRVFELINAYRVRGHLIADLDPLGWKKIQYHPELDIATYGLTIWDLDREFIASGLGGKETATLREIVALLHRYYCGKVGVEYRNIQDPEEKEWIRSRVERDAPALAVETKNQILWKLISAELFERFLGTKYLGQKRFSIEGNETVVALLDQLIESAARRGIVDITMGMSHRGRLNVIANVIGRFCERIFTSFEGSIHPRFPHDQGDVKYHQGASGLRETAEGHQVMLTVAPNPSHLEFVDPVVEGIVRAKQDASENPEKLLAVLLHGDAAFAGEGVVAETLNLSQLPGYATGGTIHIIVNNQLGFTTPPEEGRSSTYSTDIAKMIQAPIFHINSDDPESAYNALQTALDYRMKFRKDVVLDVIGFRKLGHNEGDEPTYTQPVMYQRIREHPGVRELYARRLIREGVVDEARVGELMEERMRRYENAQLGAKEIVARQGGEVAIPAAQPETENVEVIETGVDRPTLRLIGQTINTVPKGFNLNPKIVGLLARRAKMVEGEAMVDWAMAEALAFGSLIREGATVRISGQDTVRGTFSQRHAAFTDTATGEEWIPLKAMAAGDAHFHIYDSPLSEAGALGFEYGYSVAAPRTLVLWEAQFGDFANAAQVIVDQFIASGEQKWNQSARVVLLLPHGYEGQGPEHSSARLERYLQLCAEGNIRVACCTTAAQYFHLLRRQARAQAKPLIVMTPKSLLRATEASSPIEEFTRGSFLPVIGDEEVNPAAVSRVLIASGKVYYDLAAERKKRGEAKTAILRLEQFYPFPKRQLAEQFDLFSAATDIRWVQEEPRNQGGWAFVESRIREMIGDKRELRYVGRAASASTATGSHTIHQMEQRQLVKDAFAD